LAAKHVAQLFVCVDLALVVGILQLVLLDVVPHFLRHFRPRQRLGTDDRSEIRRRRHRLHERGIRLAFRDRFLGGRFLGGGLFGSRLLGCRFLDCRFLRSGFLRCTLLCRRLLCSFFGSSHSSPSG